MQKILSFYKALFLMTISSLFLASSFAAGPTIQNASFSQFVAASDSFPNWSFKKDSTNGKRYTITQETTDTNSAPGCLKISVLDTAAKCMISGSISGLTAKKIVKITAMVKYTDMPSYYNAMISLYQVSCVAPDYKWIERKWGTMWGSKAGSIDWTPITMTDTVTDSANVFNLVIQTNAGTLLVDDITIGYDDESATLKTVQSARQESIVNNRISFPSATPYMLEVVGVNGKTVLKSYATSSTVDLNRLNLLCGTYLVKVKTAEKTWSGRVLIGK